LRAAAPHATSADTARAGHERPRPARRVGLRLAAGDAGQYHQRLHPLPPARHLLAFCLLGIGGALSFLLGLFVLYGLAVIG
jgi:hypothetical protein